MDVRRTCYVCRADGAAGTDDAAWIRPCRCGGSTREVHRRCLARWIRLSGTHGCGICRGDYVFRRRARHGDEHAAPKHDAHSDSDGGSDGGNDGDGDGSDTVEEQDGAPQTDDDADADTSIDGRVQPVVVVDAGYVSALACAALAYALLLMSTLALLVTCATDMSMHDALLWCCALSNTACALRHMTSRRAPVRSGTVLAPEPLLWLLLGVPLVCAGELWTYALRMAARRDAVLRLCLGLGRGAPATSSVGVAPGFVVTSCARAVDAHACTRRFLAEWEPADADDACAVLARGVCAERLGRALVVPLLGR